MLPSKSESFSFRRGSFGNSSNSSSRSSGMQNCRRKLQDKFDEIDKDDKSNNKTTQINDRINLSVFSLNDGTRRVLRSSAERLTKTFNTVRTTIGTITQRFKISTKRRQILEEGPMTPNCATPHTFSKHVLGRTPTKLYSPFGIDSPYSQPMTYNKENVPPNNKNQLIKLKR